MMHFIRLIIAFALYSGWWWNLCWSDELAALNPESVLKLTKEPPGQVDFSNNTGIRIDCHPSVASSSVSWLFSDGTLVTNVTGLRQWKTDGSLVFAAFSSEAFRQDVHAATYHCVASGPAGSIVSRNVTVKAVMDVDYDSIVYDVFAIRGNTAVVRCHVPAFLQDYVAVVAYIRDDSLKIATPIQSDAKFSLSPSGALYVKNVNMSDAGTTYRCQTLPRLTGHMKTSLTVGRLFVNEPQGNVPPKISDYLSKVEAREGEVAILPCVAQGFPNPIMQWFIRSVVGDLMLSNQNGIRRQVSNGLVFTKVQLSDSGIYLCRANNSIGSDQVESTLIVTAHLSVKIKTPFQSVDIGSPLTLECSVSGYPVVAVWWLKNGQAVDLKRVALTNREVLHIESLSLEDKGMYQCFARNGQEVVQDAAEVRLGEFAPVFIKGFETSTVEIGNNVTIFCEVTGNPVPEIKWQLDTMTVETSRRLAISQNFDAEGNVVSTLALKESNVEDGGTYTCIGSNLRGSVQHSARINIYGQLGARKVPKTTVVAGVDAFFFCPVYGYPIDKVTWEKDSEALPVSVRQIVHENGTLQIKKVQKKADSGDYVCQVTNKIGQSVKGTLGVQILVAPKIVPFEFQDDLVREGVRARIQCVVSEGDSPLFIKWTKDGRLLSEAVSEVTFQHVDEYSSILSIGTVTPKHNGNYTCVASNAAGTVSHTARLFVNVSPKIIPFTFQDDQNFKGMRAHIICAVSQGDLPLTFEWRKDGREINGVSLGANVGSYDRHSSSLSIESVTSIHSGNYTCVASNEAGKARFTAQLVVQVAPKIVPFSFQGDHLFEGVLARVSCVVYQGDLPISIYWFKDGHAIERSGSVNNALEGLSIRNVDDYTSILTIDQVHSKHSGNYSCVAKNSAASTSHTAQLMVKVPPKVVPFSFQDDQLVEGMVVRVSCVVSRGDLPMFISWTKDGCSLTPDLGVVVRKVDEYSSVLSIDSVSTRHTGNYTCFARNEAATATHTAWLSVSVPPFWIKTPDHKITVVNGHAIMLDCQADGFPKPVISWAKFKGVSKLEIVKEENGIVLHRNGSLFINSVTESHSGSYSCKASNGIGEGLDKIVIIQVQNAAKILSNFGNLTVVRGRNLTLRCSASGDKPVRVTWLVNGKIADSSKKSRISFKEVTRDDKIISELMIKKAEKADNTVFLCRAENHLGSDQSPTNVMVQGPPDAPQSVKAIDRGSRSVEVLWSAPFDGNSPIVKYIVEYLPLQNGNLSITAVVGHLTRTIISDLKPSSTYKFTVYAENVIGRSENGGTAELVLSGEVPSGAPENVNVISVDANTLKVSWEPPKKHSWNGNIRGYNVGHRVTESGDAYEYQMLEVPDGYDKGLSFTVSELAEFTQYGIVVQAFNDQGKGPLSLEVLAMTSEGVPSESPKGAHCSTLSSKSITVSWKPLTLDTVSGILRGYRVLYWPVGQRYFDGEWQLNIFNTTTTTTTKVTLNGLSKYTNYSIQVLGYTLVGDGVASKSIYCKTLEDVPSAPEEVKVIPLSNDAVVVVWRPLKNSAGQVTQYTVLVSSKGQEVSKYSVNGNLTSYELRKLKRNQQYKFMVSATSKIGDGLPSSPVYESTASGSRVSARCVAFGETVFVHAGQLVRLTCPAVGMPLPKKSWLFGDQDVAKTGPAHVKGDGSLVIQAAQATDAGNYTCKVSNDVGHDQLTYVLHVLAFPAPPTVFVSTTSTTSVGLFWKLGYNGNSPVVGYVLHYKATEFGSWRAIDLQPYFVSYLLSGLLCGTTYDVYLVAVNEVGEGQPSDTVSVTTNGGVPTVPPLVKLIEESTTHAVVHLDSWVSNGCPILYFAVEYKPKSSRSWLLVTSDMRPDKQNQLVLDELNPGSWYNVRVRAHTNAGSSIAEYEFSTLSVNEGILSKDADLKDLELFPVVDLHIVLPSILCVVIIFICIVVTYFWVKKKQRGGVAAVDSIVNKKAKSSNNCKTQNRSRHSGSAADIAHLRSQGRQRSSIGMNDDDDDIAPYAMVKLSDIQRKEAKDRRNFSLPRNIGAHANNALPAWQQPSSSAVAPAFSIQQNYNPSAPPMSDSYHGVSQSRGSYVNSHKERVRPLREGTAPGVPKTTFKYPTIPTEDLSMETTFVFPPPPDDLRDGDYDPPPPEMDWLPTA